MKPLNLNKKLSLHQTNGPEVTPAEDQTAKEAAPLNQQPERALPAMPGELKAPDGFDEIFAMALKVRTGKPGMADFWARMAQADALHRAAVALDRFNEFLGVYDNDEDPDADSARLVDVLLEVLTEAKK